MTTPSDDGLDAALRRGVTSTGDDVPAEGLDLDEVVTRGVRRRRARRAVIAAVCVLVPVVILAGVLRGGSPAAVDTVGPAPGGTSSVPPSAGSAPPSSAGTTVVEQPSTTLTTSAPTVASTPTPTTKAPTSTPSTVRPTVPVTPAPTIAPSTAAPAPLTLAIDGLGALPFSTPMPEAIAALRARFGPEDFDSGPVGGCGPGSQNRWLRWGRLQVGFTPSDGRWLFSTWQYPAQPSNPAYPAPPTTGGPALTTAGGLGPADPPRARAAILADLQRELPEAVDAGEIQIDAARGDDVLFLTLTSPDPASTAIAFLQAERQSLFNSRC